MSRLNRIYALNALNMASLTLSQIAVVPVYLHYLGIHHYERWLFMNAIASTCQLLDFGVIFYTTNGARIAFSRGDIGAAKDMIGIGLCFFSMLFAAFGLLPLLFCAVRPASESIAFFLVLANTPFVMLRTWLSYMLTSRVSQVGELVLFIAFTLLQMTALVGTLMLGKGVMALAIVQIISTTAFGVVPTLAATKRFAPEIRFRLRWPDLKQWRAVALGSLSNFSYSAANLAATQLPIILLGAIPGLPPASLATFSTSRTLTGVVRLFCQQLARSNGIEMSRFLAPEQNSRFRNIFLLGTVTISVLAALGMGGLLPISDVILKVWTGKPELYNFPVILILCAGAVISAPMQIPIALPLFTNSARVMTLPLTLQICLLAVLGILGAISFGATGIAAAVVVAELSTLGFVALQHIVPGAGISRLTFLRNSGVPSVTVFTLSASASLASRWIVHPMNLLSLLTWAASWMIVASAATFLLYRIATHFGWRFRHQDLFKQSSIGTLT